jgi:DNA-directed RNA polymerase subunit RPC12/RpoP
VGDAVSKAAEKRQKYHGIECPNCRKLIKIPIRQMKRFAPRKSPEEAAEEEKSAGGQD